MAPDIKTEIIKLGENMSPEEREELNTVLEAAKKSAAEAEAKPSQEDPAETKTEAFPCVRCGYIEGQSAPPQEDVQEYMRATLGGRRFHKVYVLMRGNIEAMFETIDTKTSERVNSVVSKLSFIEDPVEFRGYATKLNMVYLLRRLVIGGEVREYPVSEAATPEDVTKEFVERFGNMDESVIQMLTRVMASFMTLKSALIEACFDEDFYKGAGPF